MKRARKALGSKAHSKLRSLLESGAYEVVPERDSRGQDQTFVKFKKRARKAPFKQLGTRSHPVPLRNVLYLQPIGVLGGSSSTPSPELLQTWCASYFYGLNVKVLEVIPLDDAKLAKVERVGGALSCRDIFDVLYRVLPSNGFGVIALTKEALVAGKGSDVILGGLSKLSQRVCVNTLELDDIFGGQGGIKGSEETKRGVLTRRALVVASHELTHM